MGSVEIRLETLDSFVAEHGVHQVDLLKIDVEGYELEVLKGASAALERGAVRYVYAECVFAPDSIESHTDFFEMHRVLSQWGFSFVCSYTESFRLSDGCALCNTLYALKSKLPATVTGRIRNIY